MREPKPWTGSRSDLQGHLVRLREDLEVLERDIKVAVTGARLSGCTDDWIGGILGITGRQVANRYGPRRGLDRQAGPDAR